ncbi:MAG: BTAD domain-containing putative transcriptional regulator, partial [Ardenticatenaceae bacterium]
MLPSTSLSIRLLGPFEAYVGGHMPVLRRKSRAMLAYLAVTGRAHSRRALAEMFCQETDDPSAALRSLLSRIRRQLGAETLLTEGDTVQFNRQAGWVDCLEFEQTLEGDLGQPPWEHLAARVDLYRGEFLDGLSLADAPEFELWLLGERARLRNLYERGLAEIVGRLIALQQYGPAIRWAQQLVQSNPLLEEVHAQLMWLYAQTGQREAALQQFDHCRELLARELAVEPTPELRALRDEVLSGQIGRTSPRHPIIGMDVSEEARPASDFVGREKELAHLHQAWQAAERGQGPVVLLEAEAGGGKTRLAHEFAHALPDALLLVGECYESTRALPYRPWIELLETALDSISLAALEQLPSFWLDYLMRLLPSLARRLQRQPPPAPPTTGGELEKLFTAIT